MPKQTVKACIAKCRAAFGRKAPAKKKAPKRAPKRRGKAFKPVDGRFITNGKVNAAGRKHAARQRKEYKLRGQKWPPDGRSVIFQLDIDQMVM